LNSEEIQVYPNPSNGKVYIRNQGIMINQIRVYALNGTEILNCVPKAGVSFISLDLIGSKSGIYFIKIFKEDSVFQRKLILLP